MKKNFEELKNEADSFYEDKKYENALIIYQSILKKDKDLTSTDVANLQYDIGFCYFYLEQYNYAEKHLKLYLLHLNKQTDPDKNRIANTLWDIGNTLSYNLKKEKAIENYLASLNMYVEILNEESQDIITINTEIGHCYYYLELYLKAGPFYLKAKNIAERIFGIKDEFTNYCRFDLAENLYHEGKTKEAYDEFVLVYFYFEEGNQYVNKIDVLNHLTNLCFEFPVNEKQENYYQQLYSEAVKAHGIECIDTAISAKKLGRFYNRMKNYVSAVKYFELAFFAYTKLKGELDPDTLNIAFLLSDVYYYNKQYAKAKDISEFILSTQRRRYKDDEIPLQNAVANLAYACFRTEDYANAAKLFEEAIYISNKIPETPVLYIKKYKSYFAKALIEEGEYGKASLALKRFIKEEIEHENTDEVYLVYLYDSLADNLAHIKNKAPESEIYHLKVIELYKNSLEENDPNFLEVKLKLAVLYIYKLSKSQRALMILNEILDILKKYHSQDAIIYYKTLVEAGTANRKEDNYAAALDYFQRALEFINNSEKEFNSIKIELLEDIAITEIAMGDKESAFSTLMEWARLSNEYHASKEKLAKSIIKLVKDNFDEQTGRKIIGYSHYSSRLKEYNTFVKNELYSDTNKRNVRVFISSTFRDMMNERDYMMKNVFPEIKQVCKQYGIDFTEVDLRWGITNEDVEQGKVIEVCLNEIDISRPYFIGILGERYGWVPDNSILPEIERTLENFDWLNQDIDDKLSITEMEIQYGVLRNKKMKGNAFFYLRNKELTPDNIDFFEKEGSLEFKKLQKLKKTLKSQNKYPVREFNSVKNLGELIANDLQKVIIRDTKLDRKVSDKEEWRISQLNYIKQYCEFYIPIEENLKQLDEFANSSLNKAVIYSPSGKGKSALLSNWIKARFKQQDNSPLFFHFSLANPAYDFVNGLYWWLTEELSAIFNIQNVFNSQNEDPAGEFLNVIKDNNITSDIIIVIDGIEKIQYHSFWAKLFWLPLDIPANIKLIISTNDKAYFDILKGRDFTEIVPVEMNEDQIKRFIVHYLRRFGKKLPESLIKKIVDDEVSNSPFSLKIILDELRVMGKHEELESALDDYLSAKNTLELNLKVLARIELDYDEDFPGLTSKALSLLAISMFGLSENEIIDLTNSARLFWAPIQNSLENHFTKGKEKITIKDPVFIEAIREKFLSEESIVKKYKRILADYLLKSDDLQGKAKELSELLFELGDKKNLAHLITNIKVFYDLMGKRYDDFQRYCNLIKDDFNIAELLKNNLEKGKLADVDKVDLIEPLIRISTFFRNDAKYADALFFAEESFMIAKSIYGEKHPNTASPMLTLANLYYNFLDEKAKGKKLYLKAIANIENSSYKMTTKFLDAYTLLAEIYLKEGNIKEARKYALKQKEYLSAIYSADNAAFTKLYNLLGKIELVNKNYKKAEHYTKKALRLVETNLGTDSVLYQASITDLVEVYNQKGEDTKALELLIESKQVLSEKLGENNALTLVSRSILASKYCDLKEYDKAEKISLKLVELAIKNNQFESSSVSIALYNLKDIYRLNHITGDKFIERKECFIRAVTGISMQSCTTAESAENYSHVGDVYYRFRDYNNAIINHKEALSCYNNLPEKDEKEISRVYKSLGYDFYWLGYDFYWGNNYDQAIINYLKAYEIHSKLYGIDSKEADYARNNLGLSYKNVNMYSEAIAYFTASLITRKKLYGEDSKEVNSTRFDLGQSYKGANMYSEAIACFTASLNFQKKIYGKDSEEVDGVREFLGQSYHDKGENSKAIECLSASLEFAKQFYGEESERYKSLKKLVGKL